MKILRNFSKIWRQTHVHIQPIYFWGCIPTCHDSYLVRIGSYKPAVQSVSQCMQAKHCFPVMAKPLAKKPENFICVLAAGKDYAFCKACHKSVMVTVSCQYNVTRHCQSDDHLGAVTKRMQHALIDQHMRQQQKRADSTLQVTAAELMFCKFAVSKHLFPMGILVKYYGGHWCSLQWRLNPWHPPTECSHGSSRARKKTTGHCRSCSLSALISGSLLKA